MTRTFRIGGGLSCPCLRSPPIASVENFNGLIIGGDGLGIALEDGSASSLPWPPPTVATETLQSASSPAPATHNPHTGRDSDTVSQEDIVGAIQALNMRESNVRLASGAVSTTAAAARRTGVKTALEGEHVGQDTRSNIAAGHSNMFVGEDTRSNIAAGPGGMTTTRAGARRDTFVGGHSNTFVGEDTRSNLRLDGGGVMTAQDAAQPERVRGRAQQHLAGAARQDGAAAATTTVSMDTARRMPAGEQRDSRLTTYAATAPPRAAAALEQDGFAQKLADLNRDINLLPTPTECAPEIPDMLTMRRLLLAKDTEIALLRARLEYTEQKLERVTRAHV